jgi:hypothetical protein
VHFVVTGRDETVRGNFIGPLMHGEALRRAIAEGYGTYDFCHGNEPYKYGFGAEETRVSYISIRRRDQSDPAWLFDPQCAGHGMEKVRRWAGRGERDEALAAVRGMQQVLRLRQAPGRG